MSQAIFRYRSLFSRVLYLSYHLIWLFCFYIPIWAIFYAVPWFRPITRWTWGRAMVNRVLGHLFGLFAQTGPDAFPSHSHRSLDTRFGVKGIWIPPVPQLIHANLSIWARVSNVESIHIPGYWYDRPCRKTSLGCPPTRTEKCIMMLHGGAMISGSAHPFHPFSILPRRLVKHVGLARRLFSVEYRLSSGTPFEAESPFPAALIDALAGYNYLVNVVGFKANNIILAGDSAGGNLALALTRYLVDNHLAYPSLPSPPGSLILLSPWVDLSPSHIIRPCTTDYLGHPSVLALLEYAKTVYTGPHGTGAAAFNAYISPASLTASVDWHGFPRTFIAAGGAEYLVHEIRALRSFMSGYADVFYFEAAHAVHDWAALGILHEPEGTALLNAIAKWTSIDRSIPLKSDVRPGTRC